MAIAPTPTPATTRRSVKAATQRMLTNEEAADLYLVDNGKQGDDHDQYRVDLEEPACTCPDFQYRAESDDRVRDHGCAHIRRVRMERGEIDVGPLRATDLSLDPFLLEAIDDA